MRIHASARARHASYRPRRGWASTALSDLTEQALAAVVICFTVAYALHAAPSSLSMNTADASDSHQPSFSIEKLGGSHTTVCESASAIRPDGATGNGACTINLFSMQTLAPGSAGTTRIRISGTGPQQINALSLRPLTECTQNATTASTAAHDFCQQIHLHIECGSRLVFEGSAAELGHHTDTPIPLTLPRAHHAVVLTTEVSLPRTLGNTYQALTARLPLLLTAAI